MPIWYEISAWTDNCAISENVKEAKWHRFSLCLWSEKNHQICRATTVWRMAYWAYQGYEKYLEQWDISWFKPQWSDQNSWVWVYFLITMFKKCTVSTKCVRKLKKTSVALATESSGYVCLRNPCDPSWFAACPCEVGIELDNMLVPFYWGSLYIICTFVHSLILKYPLFRHNCLIYTHIRTYRRTNTRPEYIYWVYSRRSTTFAFRWSLNSWFLTIFDIFSSSILNPVYLATFSRSFFPTLVSTGQATSMIITLFDAF